MNDVSAMPDATRLRQIASELDLPFVDAVSAASDLFSALPVETALELNVVPLSREGDLLTVATADPLDMRLEGRLAAITGHRIALAVTTADSIRGALRRSDSSDRMLSNVSSDFRPQIIRETEEGGEEVVDIEAIQGQSGVVRLTNSILMAALQRQASDIHIETFADRVDVKLRIDGVLYPAMDPIDLRFQPELISRIKVMADLDIAERRVPQDGRFRLRIDGRDVDFRVSILPAQFAENCVIRVLDKSAVARFGDTLSLDDLGLGQADKDQLRATVRQPYGLVLITGPTGSGKTTTLYAALSEIAGRQEKIITIEDPIEYQLDGITQIAVNEKKGLTFASGLRSILRHDPDKIMVGEIRDLDTAQIAIQAALTGHLVLASVHANSAFDVISRFTHWGIDLYDFVAALNAVLGQRLLRRACADCSGKGCGTCGQTGYRGRVAVVEQLTLTPEVSALILDRRPVADLRAAAVAAGMRPIAEVAAELERRGVTTQTELTRVMGAT